MMFMKEIVRNIQFRRYDGRGNLMYYFFEISILTAIISTE
jgi:hypothetical protein